jgi:putative hemolysin
MESSTRRAARFDDPRQLSVTLAATDRDVDAAQRLRYRVFAGGMGARLSGLAAGRDEDEFDAWCEHLIVRDERCGEVVGTYRVLTADRAARLGSFYADTEFDLSRLAPLRPGMCEIGRACIHPDYRDGGVIMLLWQGLAALMQERRCRTLIGCASIAMDDGGANALSVWRRLARTHLAPDANRVFPRRALPRLALPRLADVPETRDAAPAAIPALLEGYLRVGAWIGGEPAWDEAFGTADLFVMMPLERVEGRYARHYLKAA